jgi:hypothetical protein
MMNNPTHPQNLARQCDKFIVAFRQRFTSYAMEVFARSKNLKGMSFPSFLAVAKRKIPEPDGEAFIRAVDSMGTDLDVFFEEQFKQNFSKKDLV